MEQLSRAGASLIDKGKMGEVIALLQRLGVQTITKLLPDQYAACADGLRALGADI